MILITSNPRKLAEFRRFGLPLEMAAGPDLAEVAGDAETVAIHKAIAAGEGSLVEDTILVVEGREVVDIRWRLAELAGGSALWVTTLAHNDGAEVVLYRGEVAGHLVRTQDVPSEGAFGFDPWFVPNGAGATLAALEAVGRKDAFSARRRAVQALLDGHAHRRVAVASIPAWSGGWQHR